MLNTSFLQLTLITEPVWVNQEKVIPKIEQADDKTYSIPLQFIDL